MNVPLENIVAMSVSLFFAVALFIGLMIGFKKKTGSKLGVFFIGSLCFFVFALLLEQLLHSLVLSLTGDAISGNTWLYAIYGGLAAGVFEECGRAFGFGVLLRKRDIPGDSLMYGAGHGGFEALYLLGIGMITNLIVALALNSDADVSSLGYTTQQLAPLTQSQPLVFLYGIIERCSAVVLHISLSVLVWTAVKRKKRYRLPIAILIHALVNTVSVIAANSIASYAVIEAIIAVMSVCAAVYASRVYKAVKSAENVKNSQA